MPTIPASAYTEYIKNRAANLAYASRTPIPIQTISQPYSRVSILNAKILASEIGSRVNPRGSTLVPVNGVLGRVRPPPTNYVNNPNALSVLTYQRL
jgi:hypothetical protein